MTTRLQRSSEVPVTNESELNIKARQITRTLFLTQGLVSAAMIAIATVNSIVGTQLGGSPRWAGVPTAVYLVGGATAAFVWGYLMDALGRRGALVLGQILGMAGAFLATVSIVAGFLAGFLAGLVLVGAANAAMQLGRFVSAEVHPPKSRGTAISNVVIGGTVGAVAGPLLVGPAGRLATSLGTNELSGAFGAGGLLLAAAATLIFVGLRPEPRLLAQHVADRYPTGNSAVGSSRSIGEILRQPAAAMAVLAMVTGQVVMVGVMVITSVHMKGHQHDLGDISLVISAHTFGMFAFSILSGRLADRWGRGQVILVGSGTLVLACLTAPLSPDVLPLAVSLFLLGLGWNFCFVGGSTLLADQLSPAERSRTQGFNDLLVGLAAATGSVGSGLVFAAVGFDAMAMIAAVLAMVPLVISVAWLRGGRQFVGGGKVA